jgi:hypothetical protein
MISQKRRQHQQTNVPPSQAISKAMMMPWCNAKHIAQYGRSGATLDATGRCHKASIFPILSRRMPWSLILLKKQVVALRNCFSEASIQKAQNKTSTQLIKATSCIQTLKTMFGGEELSNSYSCQTLKIDINL